MPFGKHIAPSIRLEINDEPNISGKPSIALFPHTDIECYRCHYCNHLTPKSNASISGFNSEHSLQHIHCSKCGRIISWSPEGSKIRSIAEGAFFTSAGGALAFLLYPSLNIYGLQIGFFASLYGVLKAIFL
jgi:RNase P subunit RPR2